MEQTWQSRAYSVLGTAAPAWDALLQFLRANYTMDELYNGKNELKFRKNGKTLATLYFDQDSFSLLLIYGARERDLFTAQTNDFPAELVAAYESSKTYHDGKWMFLPVRDMHLIEPLTRMIQIKKRPNRKG